jgi:hypothetical protein
MEGVVNFPGQGKFQLIRQGSKDPFNSERSFTFQSDLLVVHSSKISGVQPDTLSFCEAFQGLVNSLRHTVPCDLVSILGILSPLGDPFKSLFQTRDFGRGKALGNPLRLVSHDDFEWGLFPVCMGSAIVNEFQ